MQEELVKRIANALSDKHRLTILQEISKNKDISCSELNDIIHLSQPTVSHHIKILSESGVINVDKEGKCLKFSINEKNLSSFVDFFHGMLN